MDAVRANAVLQHALSNRSKAKTFIVTGVKWLAAGAPLASPETLSERQSICAACEHWKPIAGAADVFHCSECKCLAGKLRLATSQCPLPVPKWGPEVK